MVVLGVRWLVHAGGTGRSRQGDVRVSDVAQRRRRLLAAPGRTGRTRPLQTRIHTSIHRRKRQVSIIVSNITKLYFQ